MTHYPSIIMQKEIRLLFKSKRRIFLLLMIPMIILLAGVVTTSITYFDNSSFEPTHVWVIDNSPGKETDALISLWSTINNSKVEKITGDFNSIVAEMNFEVLVLIPNNYTTLRAANQTAQIAIAYNANDTRNEQITVAILQYNELYSFSLVKSQNPDIQFNVIDSRVKRLAPQNEGVDKSLAQVLVIVPVYIIFFVVISPISLVLISVTIEREQRTLEVLFLQPVKRRAIVIGKIYYGLFLVVATLVLDIIAGFISYLLFKTALATKVASTSDEGFPLIDFIHTEEILAFVIGIAVIATVIISFAVLLSLLAKDEKEANMISGIIPMLIMGMVVIIFIVPIADMGIMGQFFMSIIPIMGIIVTIYLSTLAGGVVPLTYVSIAAQLVWSALIIALTARISEAESILELSYGKVFAELKHIFRKKK